MSEGVCVGMVPHFILAQFQVMDLLWDIHRVPVIPMITNPL